MILPLEKQTVCLELAKKMRELGFEQKSLWYWEERFSVTDYSTKSYELIKENKITPSRDISYSAYTVAELLGRLSIVKYDSMGFPCLQVIFVQFMNEWHVHYRNPPLEWSKNGSQDAGHDKKLADSCAKMLIYLKENNLI